MLVKLLLLRFRGGVRHRLQELKTLRGLLFLCVTIAVFVLLMKQSSLPGNLLGGALQAGPEQLREQFARLMPAGLLAACLLTVFTSAGPAIHFSPSEINLLFSGPFSRRALLLYKMCFYAFGALLSSLLITLLVPAFTHTLLATFLGAFLTLMFIQLFSAVIGLVSQLLLGYFYVPVRRSYVIILSVAALAVLVWYLAGMANGLAGALALFQSSFIGNLVLAPFDVFVHIFLAQSVSPDLLGWAALGFAINAGLLAVIILLDGHSYEASVAASLKLHKRWIRARRSGLLWGAQPVVVHSFRQPPLVSGIGPIAWRQLLTALRTSSKPVLVFLGVAMLAGPLLVIAAADISMWSRIGFVFFVAVYVLPRSLVFDFRSDLDGMEVFKALPLRAWKISAGQLAAPVLLTSLIELLLLGSVAVFLDGTPRVITVAMISFLVPFNMLLYGLENLLFLLFPTPLVPVGRVDFDFLGRTMVEFMVKTTLLISACGLAAGAGVVVLNAAGRSWPAFAGVAWTSLVLIALLMLPLLSWAFCRFDISRR
ncbi:MAG: putative ABC exporter domain-containing protein [Pseudomonadota bacterium]